MTPESLRKQFMRKQFVLESLLVESRIMLTEQAEAFKKAKAYHFRQLKKSWAECKRHYNDSQKSRKDFWDLSNSTNKTIIRLTAEVERLTREIWKNRIYFDGEDNLTHCSFCGANAIGNYADAVIDHEKGCIVEPIEKASAGK